MTAALMKVGDGWSVPVDFVIETAGIVGVKGSGKSSTAKVLVEQLTLAKQQCVIVDPTGAWYGLRSSVDGKRPGLPFAIIGGPHGDVPLTEDMGKLIAELAVQTDTPLVLDLADLRKAAAARFMLAFVSELYHQNRRPLHLVVDECDLFVPQRAVKGQEALLGAMEDLVRRGRKRGIGVTMISQRPASVNKDVLSQVSTFIAHRLIGPQDRAAFDSWVTDSATPEQRKQMMSTFAGQPTGTAWVWSPAWLGIFQQVAMHRSQTFDSMATPKPGQPIIEPKVWADVDTDMLRTRLKAIVDDRAANDPKVLRATVVRLTKQLELAEQRTAKAQRPAQVVTETVKVEVVPPAVVELLAAGIDHLADVQRVVQGALDLAQRATTTTPTSKPRPVGKVAQGGVITKPGLSLVGDVDMAVGKTERNILSVLYQHGPLTHAQIALLAGYSPKASTIGVSLARLRGIGYVDRNGQPVTITDTGRAFIADDVEQLPEGAALLDYWRNRFGLTERRVLDVVVQAWPDTTSQAEIANAAGYSEKASTIGVALGKLRKVGVVDGWCLNADFARLVGL